MRYSDEQVAEMYHAWNIAHQGITGDDMPSQPWMWLTRTQRAITIRAVKRVRAGAITTAEEHHEAWYREMNALGTIWAPDKDPQAMPPTHPAMLHWAALPQDKRDKSIFFVGLVQLLSRD